MDLLGSVQRYFNPTSNGGNNFWRTPVARVLAGASRVPRFNFQPAVQRIESAIPGQGLLPSAGRLLATLPVNVGESILNTPSNLVQAPIDVANELAPVVRGQKPFNPVNTLAKAAPFAEAELNIATLGLGAPAKAALSQAAQRNLRAAIAKSALTGAKYGAGYGGISGLEQSENATVEQAIKNVLSGAGQGLLLGGALGGSLPLLRKGAEKIFRHSPKPLPPLQPGEEAGVPGIGTEGQSLRFLDTRDQLADVKLRGIQVRLQDAENRGDSSAVKELTKQANELLKILATDAYKSKSEMGFYTDLNRADQPLRFLTGTPPEKTQSPFLGKTLEEPRIIDQFVEQRAQNPLFGGALSLIGKQMGRLLNRKGKSVEQIAEEKGGFQPGTKVQFDTALATKNADEVRRLLPIIPKPYVDSFQNKINEVLNDKGVTIKAFHGEGEGRSPIAGAIKEPTYGEGKYYSTNPNYAGVFGKVTQEDVRLENPLIIDSQNQLSQLSQDAIKNGYENVADYAKNIGHDGLINHLDETIVKFKKPELELIIPKGTEPQAPTQVFQPGIGTQVQPLRFLKDPQLSVPDMAYKQTVANGGVTISLKGKQPAQGFAYSPYKQVETVVPKANFTPQIVNDFIVKNQKLLAEKGNHLGIWEDNGNVYLDISKVGAPNAKTLQSAQEAQQLAAFDLKTFEEIPLGKIENGVYNRIHEAVNHPYLNRGKDTTANPTGSAGGVGEVPKNSKPATAGEQSLFEQPLAGIGVKDQSVRFLTGTKAQEKAKSEFLGGKQLEEPQKDGITGAELGSQRQFLQTIQESPMSAKPLSKTETVKKAAENLPQEYGGLTNEAAVTKADALIKSNVTAAEKLVLDAKTPVSADKSATAIRLLQKYDKEGNEEAAEKILSSYDNQLREAGRFVQAASLWNRMSPEGTVKMAQRVAERHGKKLDEDTVNFIRKTMLKVNAMPEGEAKNAKTLEVLNAIADKIPLTKGEIFDTYRYNNMLSNPRTHERNIFQNLLNTYVTRPIDLAFESYYDLFRHPFNPMARDVSLLDVPKYYGHVFTSTNNAFRAAIEAFKTGEFGNTKLDMSKGDSVLEALRQKKQPALFKAIPNFLTAQDAFFQTLIASGEKARLLARKVPEEQAETQARNLAKEYLYRNKLGEDMGDKTKPYLVRALDALGNFALQGRKLPVVGKPYSWFVPFVTTPTNVAKLMVEHSPLGLVGGSYGREQVARAVGGSLVSFAGALLASEGRTTWAAPTDAQAKDLFYASGRKPFSVLIGDKWVPMWYFGSYALALAIPAAVKQYYEDDRNALTDSAINKIGNIAGDISSFIVSQTPLSGVGGFFRLLDGDSDVTPGNLLGFTAGQAIPFQGLIRYVNTILDPVFRKSSGFTDTLLKDASALSKTGIIPELEARTDPYGNPSKRETQNFFLPYDVGTRQEMFEAPLQERTTQMKVSDQLNEIERQAQKDSGVEEPRKVAFRLYNQIKAAPDQRSKLQILQTAARDGTLSPSVKSQLEDMIRTNVFAISGEEKALKSASIRTRAVTIVQKLKSFQSREEKLSYIQRLKQVGVLSSDVEKEIANLIQQGGVQNNAK